MKCDVNIFGMLVDHDDVVHADVHGAVVIPAEAVRSFQRRSTSWRDARRLFSTGRARLALRARQCVERSANRAKSTDRGQERRVASQPLRVGVIGCGFFAENHLAAWASMDDVALAAVCDLDLGKARSAAERHKAGAAYADATEMLDREQLDFVDIVTTMNRMCSSWA